MFKSKRNIILILPGLLYCFSTFSQEYRIRNFGSNVGISHPFVYTINQDNQGYIWVGTGEGICRFNGFAFNTDVKQDSLAREVAGVSYKDSQGNLWFGYYSGDLARYDGNKLEIIDPGLALNSAITGFCQIDPGHMLISTLNKGLLNLNVKTGKAEFTGGLNGLMCTTFCLDGSRLLIGTPDGLMLCSYKRENNQAVQEKSISELDLVKIQDIEPTRKGKSFWVSTEDQGVYFLTLSDDGYTIHKTGAAFKIENKNAQSVLEDSEGQLWVSTLRDGVYKLSKPDGKGDFGAVVHLNKDNGLPGNSIKKVFEDVEGDIWIATYGEGISLLTGEPFSFDNFNEPGLDNDIQSVATMPDGTEFFGGSGGLFIRRTGHDAVALKVGSIPNVQVTALAPRKNDLLVGTATNGLFRVNVRDLSAHQIPYDANSMGNWVNSIAVADSGFYLGTKDGIYEFDRGFNQTAHYTTTEKLPYNNIECVYIDSKKRVLFATRTNGIYQLTRFGEPVNLFPANEPFVEFKSITEDDRGAIWAATSTEGVFRFQNDSLYHFTSNQGLKSDYCYSIISCANHSVWVGHRLGISRINTANLRISKYEISSGIQGDCNLNAVFRDSRDILYFGTNKGLVTYNPAREPSHKIPPFTHITRLLISDKPYPPDKPLTLPYSLYRLRIDFIGLNYRDPESVRYQYKLEGHDLAWSDVTDQTFASYPRLDDGNYTFLVRAYNSDGLSSQAPIAIHMQIRPPFWRTWWFMVSVILILLIGIYIFIKIRERKQKQLQEYLEKELAARTKEVVEQKEVIEIKNRDITDSINYAKRIQTSLLPPGKKLQSKFSGYFVFYQPRDIVSGDFYWFDQISDQKFIVVCADSTGHGVPGAFMSMIGSTLIKDICNRQKVISPSAILQALDCELRNMLSQNLDDGTNPTDGIDIIACEIDLKTHYVRYATAMRPMIIYKNSEEIFVKGSRNSVGGHYDRERNIFEDEGIQLSKGDIIYMFSDGYSDQFGGPMGKKFKMVRLKNLLQEIHLKPMEEQYNTIRGNFLEWMENYEQVDDVLFMGIKI